MRSFLKTEAYQKSAQQSLEREIETNPNESCEYPDAGLC